MSKEAWKTLINAAIALLTALATTIGTTSCMGISRLF